MNEAREDRQTAGILWPAGLSGHQIEDIKKLEKACLDVEILNMKLNWEMLSTRPSSERNDLLMYEDGRLVAFLGLYAISPESGEVEITGMVHPDCRRRGIFTRMLGMALIECKSRGASKILLIAERSCESGMAFMKSTGFEYEFSEYRMRNDLSSIPAPKDMGIKLRKAVQADYAGLSGIDSGSFGDDPLPEAEAANIYSNTWVAELNGTMIGKIGLETEGSDGYVFGFAIVPELRGKGYGREVLIQAIGHFVAENARSVLLEVAVLNDRALGLYKSCGFEVITIYDYYKKLL